MATYPASGTLASNFGMPRGQQTPFKTIEFIVDLDLAGATKMVTGDVFNIESISANTVLLGGQAEVIDPSVGGTAVPLTIACNGITIGAFTAVQVNSLTKLAPVFPAPGANTVLAAAANLTATAGTVTGTVTKNGKYKIKLYVI